MSETTELILGLCALIVVITLTRKYHAWRIKRAYLFIVEDLKAQNAYTPASAVDLPYARKPLLRLGTRDHRPMALDHLVVDNIIGITEDGKYFLKDESI